MFAHGPAEQHTDPPSHMRPSLANDGGTRVLHEYRSPEISIVGVRPKVRRRNARVLDVRDFAVTSGRNIWPEERRSHIVNFYCCAFFGIARQRLAAGDFPFGILFSRLLFSATAIVLLRRLIRDHCCAGDYLFSVLPTAYRNRIIFAFIYFHRIQSAAFTPTFLFT